MNRPAKGGDHVVVSSDALPSAGGTAITCAVCFLSGIGFSVVLGLVYAAQSGIVVCR